eukprot:TRINITY_DN6766_c0_g1_i10.p1 TRINITY_DN6766_c0_g1~~TRINITY_DN6766_c0_g1_i10.p1  ORF type:complete len:350 (-),score=74.27 TRINITY_DN6766_c0_g1_i10:93-1142(-)
MLDLVAKLIPIMPAPNLDCFFFWNSGSEAVEASVKLARHATKKQNIVVFNGSFHGRTFGAMSLTTSKTIYREGYGPLLSGVFVAPFPKLCREKLRVGSRISEDELVSFALEDIETMLKEQTSPSETAAFLIEPVLGEGGYIPAPRGFLQGLREITKKNEILMIVDEVQAGFGRTGKWFAIQHYNVVPDILIFAKGIGSGMPLSGIVSRHELMTKQSPGSMGGTYAGNAVSCAAALATIDVIQSEDLLTNATARGYQLKKGLHELSTRFPETVGDIRGMGLMIALEFCEKKGKSPFASLLTKNCLKEGLLLLTCGGRDAVRFAPALNIKEEEVELGLRMFEKGLLRTLNE